MSAARSFMRPMPNFGGPLKPVKVLPGQEPLPDEHRNAWEYVVEEILPVIKDGPDKSFTNSKEIRMLMGRPLKRYIELRGNRPVSCLWLNERGQLLGLLMYLTGDVVENPCSYCAQGSGIFEKCVIVRDLWNGFIDCATHLHNGHAQLCDVQPRPWR
ncbi:hypothetical protein VMCG_05977 [Cytospora schulzeri]|uniref:Uncharacterized protein n=1 Tax=Cytospora schulzeri TaxID=448051 RepID=A0A423WD47_9PEZI|nr:hypothetical protein VMCG_05977 [Valsa malicola]